MSEEQIERVKAEAKEQSGLAMCFAIPTLQGLQNLGASAEMIMRMSFIAGASFGFKMKEEEK